MLGIAGMSCTPVGFLSRVGALSLGCCQRHSEAQFQACAKLPGSEAGPSSIARDRFDAMGGQIGHAHGAFHELIVVIAGICKESQCGGQGVGHARLDTKEDLRIKGLIEKHIPVPVAISVGGTHSDSDDR